MRRWVTLWESTGEEALQGSRLCSKEGSDLDPSILLSCPDFVFQLRSWIKANGGKNEDGYLTIQHIQQYIKDELLKKEDVLTEVLDIHKERYHSHEVSCMTVLRWAHKLGFKWADSSAAPFCDRHEDEDVVAYGKVWVDAMLSLKPRLPVFNETTGKPEWPNLPAGERPLLHGNHYEAILYANQFCVGI